MKIKLSHESRVFSINVEEKGKLFQLEANNCDPFWKIGSIKEELKDKTFAVTFHEHGSRDEILDTKSETLNFKELIEFWEDPSVSAETVEVNDPNNIVSILDRYFLRLMLKNPQKHIKSIKESQIDHYDYLKDLKGMTNLKNF